MGAQRADVRLAVAQPLAGREPDPAAATEELAALTRRAAGEGAELVLFPEGFPGPLRTGSTFDAEPQVAAAARESGCAVCWSRVESTEGRHHIVVYLHDREGRRAARYVRAHPATGDVHPTLSGTGIHPGHSFVVADLDGVRVGVLVCSELWIPEVARLLALRGAEVLLAPAGGGFGEVAANWRLLARARAIENECYLALTAHRFGGEPGVGLIAGPEGLLADGPQDELLVATADLERRRWLCAQDDSMAEPKPFRSLPGLLRARRPELYGELCAVRGDEYDYSSPPAPAA